ncbi:FecR domain-containing protein [Nevskia sp.]|uniref:FecR domain-containing protein n=1 Tax=Nevskia sp. TaxID=1929292 RepID=UPI0025F83473|nr:FecR domain-containing protein [Nevskia sp.]
MSAAGEAIDAGIVHEAAGWLAQLHSGEASEADRSAWQQWRHRSTEHERAWQRAETLLGTLGGIPAGVGLSTFRKLDNRSRRAALKTLALLLTGLPAGWAAYRATPLREIAADQRTAIGERREIVLADGSRLTLNTDSAVDLHFDTRERRVRLRRGEIFIATAVDPAPIHRPFVIETAQGRIRALGTRFVVRQFDDHSRVAVSEGAVEISPDQGGTVLIVNAGQQAEFGAASIGAPQASDPLAAAWTRGLLVADNQRLADFAAELSRHRPGILRCDPEVADLRISGAFQLAEPDRVLALLQQTFPVRVEARSRWWLSLRARREK